MTYGNVYQDKKSGHWYIQLSWDCKPERFYRFENKGQWLPFYSKELADFTLSLMRNEIKDLNFNPAVWRKNSPLAIRPYVDQWLPLADIVKNTRKKYKCFSNKFIEFLGVDKDIRKINKVDILLLKQHLEEKGYAKKTVNHILNTLKTVLHFALSNKDLKELPAFPKLKNPIKDKIEYLSIEIQDKVLAEIPIEHRPIFEMGAEYGLRVGEIRAIKKDAVTDTHLIICRRMSEYELLEGDKAGNVRPYFLTSRAREILKKTYSFSDFVFTHNGKSPYDSKILNKLWREACGKVGIKIRLNNGLRHSRAGQMLDAKFPIELVSELLGHSKIQITRDMYGRVSETRITEALESVRGQLIQFEKVKNEN